MLAELIRFPLFRDLSSADLKIIAPLFHARKYPEGAIVIEQGERAEWLYLLTQGEVVIRYKPYDGEPINLNRIRAGGVFGWSAVLGSATYSSSVVCNTPCEVLAVRGDELRTLQEYHPQTGHLILDRLAQAVSSRWLDAQQQVKSMIRKGVKESVSPLGNGGPLMTETNVSPKEAQLRALVENLSAYIEQFHGGSVEFISFDDVTLKVRLGGACLGCPLSPSTLHGWVEGTIKQFFPEVRVEAA
ncbi:MAG: cyclic nucleotide-binding domain-containing protein [Anaerolineales bacterium]|nr:cyclic nucleotide-binding domain-containing protein [Anaerolineales bacterium]MCX7755784.1 cyclic nucleotide-binding domain-containing protein [Anaerolineales bacterium]MDW8279042.1 cyclic nucleotide-binding domain-containing protein [Anaerolineales bacterium]